MARARRGTRERIVHASKQLFRSQGYSGTGLKRIVADADAPWGSLYHFFRDGKTQLGCEVIADAAVEHASALDEVVARSAGPLQAIERVFKAESRLLEKSRYRDGCPVASVASDVATTDKGIREECSKAFSSWERAIANAFEAAGTDAKEAARTASGVLSALEGAILLSRTHRSVAPLENTLALITRGLSARYG